MEDTAKLDRFSVELLGRGLHRLGLSGQSSCEFVRVRREGGRTDVGPGRLPTGVQSRVFGDTAKVRTRPPTRCSAIGFPGRVPPVPELRTGFESPTARFGWQPPSGGPVHLQK